MFKSEKLKNSFSKDKSVHSMQIKNKALSNKSSNKKELINCSSEIGAHWVIGNWADLKSIPKEVLEKDSNKALLAALIAVANYQENEFVEAEYYLDKAIEWGMSNFDVAKILTSSVYNSLGRFELLLNKNNSALNYFKQALELDETLTNLNLLAKARASQQAEQLEIRFSVNKNNSKEEIEPNDLSSNISYTSKLMSIINYFAFKIINEGENLTIDNVEVFKEQDPFLQGKIALGLAYWVIEFSPGSRETRKRCFYFKRVMKKFNFVKIESWGIAFYLKALKLLSENELLFECFDYQDLVNLQFKLDWRNFVDENNYKLIDKANNFYGVAYSIAFARYELGWESAKHSQILLELELNHYDKYSSDSGFADETNGYGRYDRYSFLLIAEIAYRFYESSMPLTKKMKSYLKASASFVLYNVNDDGDGFQWGRSIGAYGDSAYLEILTAAYIHNLLNEDEKLVACYFIKKITYKFLYFWFQSDRMSINIWTDGRSTDAYRGKHRILGENFSLLHQHLYCQKIWERYEFYNNDNLLYKKFNGWCKNRENSLIIKFKKNDCNYSFISYFSNKVNTILPLINGERYHNQMAYQAIPFTKSWFSVVPDLRTHVLSPILQAESNVQYIPHPCYENIFFDKKESSLLVSFENKGFTQFFCKIPDKELSSHLKTSYTFGSGFISAQQEIFLNAEASIVSILYYLPLGKEVLSVSDHTFIFIGFDGEVKELEFNIDHDLEVLNSNVENIGSTIEQGELMVCKMEINVLSVQKLILSWAFKDKAGS
ncbi:MAG: tetratricopeptide repeat protein [Halomonas sp.]|nr:tetratricopeptide repeat protein [Halomonas sp.]MBP5980594.1 tetratricopeptide repeat protein [Halomonas sp.]